MPENSIFPVLSILTLVSELSVKTETFNEILMFEKQGKITHEKNRIRGKHGRKKPSTARPRREKIKEK